MFNRQIQVNIFSIILGSKNYVLVDCPDAKHFSCCNILDLNSNSSKNLPLVKTEKNLLLCGPFKPNNNPFYVQVNHVI